MDTIIDVNENISIAYNDRQVQLRYDGMILVDLQEATLNTKVPTMEILTWWADYVSVKISNAIDVDGSHRRQATIKDPSQEGLRIKGGK